MKELRQMMWGFALGIGVVACAGAAFSYHYYGMSLVSYTNAGKLLGPTPADDKDISVCENNGCVVMLSADFFAFKQDYLDIQNQLNACQHQ